jgi:hypothetical protein
MKSFILKSKNGYVHLDVNSGGYPNIVESLFRANLWRTKEEAISYSRKFPKENFTVCEVDENKSGISIIEFKNDWEVGETVILPGNFYHTTYINQINPRRHEEKISVHGIGDDSIHLAKVIVELLIDNNVAGQKV